ncbi:hypothetical protein [Parapedobacter soli]|uniref:hypothetical protein n=1 Tax=Parapedobacter soli TaxID=416955 RepID=UPI0021C67B89|nr:hypothetical protein [Parapedobacter soli]
MATTFTSLSMRWKKHALIWICYFLATYLLNFIGGATISPLPILLAFACYVGTFYLLNAIAYHYFTYQHLWKTLLQLALAITALYIAAYALIYILLPMVDVYLYDVGKPFHLGKYIRNMTHHLEPALLTSSTYQLMRVAQQHKERIYKQQQTLLEQERELSNALNLKLEAERIQSQLKEENERLRIAALQSRLKSHWTHGVWMTIRSGILSGDRSAELFDAMTDLERTYYQYIGTDHMWITLADEMDIMEKLARINGLAKPHETEITFRRGPHMLMRQVPALSLSTTLENALKYGDFTDPEHPVQVAVSSDKDKMVFTCRNKIDPAKAQTRSTGLGLRALQKQLDLFYPNRNRIHIEDDGTFYTITITIHF